MTTYAKPCIRCGKQLENVFDDSENQASEGLYFRSSGAYGSTAFDPMDGSFIEINICDTCLLAAREEGRVLWGRDVKPVLYDGCVVGWCRTPNRPLLEWTGKEISVMADSNPGNDILHVDEDDLRHPERLPEIKWSIPPEDLLSKTR